MTVPANNADKDVPTDIRIVEITRETVELYKILKFEGMAASGGEAKLVVANGQVLVNGKVETRKRKKITAGDTIEFNNEKMGIKLASTVTAEVSSHETKAKPAAKRRVIQAKGGKPVASDVENK